MSAPAPQPPLPEQPPVAWGGGPAAGGWGPPPWAHVRPTSTKAVLAVALLWAPIAPIVFGVLARREIARTGEGGHGMATWGLGLGIAHASLYVLHFLFLVVYVLAIVGFASQAFSSGVWSP